jgi:hypothetical protein
VGAASEKASLYVKEEKMMSTHGRGIVVFQAAIGELILDWSTEPLTEPPEREREREREK